jgi:urease alpha subunit
MRRLALMENITMTNTTQSTRVRFVCPQIADRSLTVGVGGAFEGTGLSAFGSGPLTGFGSDLRISAVTPVPTFYAPMHKAVAVKDVAYLRTWSPPV